MTLFPAFLMQSDLDNLLTIMYTSIPQQYPYIYFMFICLKDDDNDQTVGRRLIFPKGDVRYI